MRSRPLVLLVLLAALLLVSLPRRSTLAAAQTPASNVAGLDIVQSAYDDLLSFFYRPLDPGALLDTGWNALSRDLQESGAPAPSLGSLPAGQAAAFAAFASAYDGALAQAPAGRTATAVAYDVAGAMASGVGDDHTNFLPPGAYQSLILSLGGAQAPIGAGIRLAPGDAQLVTAVAPGGPADEAGIVPGDRIVEVNGAEVTSGGPQALNQTFGAPAGTVISVTVDRGGRPLDVMLTIGSYYFPALESRLLPGGAGYIRLDRFVSPGLILPDGTEILSDLDRRLNDLEAQGAQGLILDLRDNGGGDLSTAEGLLGRFLPESTLATRAFDERGNQSYDLVSGLMRRVQLPMVVLVNGRSASASEVTASTLRDAGRAVLVGERTAGALAEAQLVALPEGAGMEIAEAEAESAQTGTRIDRVGVPVDIEAADTRTAADYAAGSDPQLAAAVAALAHAPQPPGFDSTPTDLTASDLEAEFGRLLPDPSQIPTNDRLTQVAATNHLDFTHPNEWIDANGGAIDPIALQTLARARGYRGSVLQVYGLGPELQPSVQISIDVYASVSGATQAVEANDFSESQVAVASPVQLGDETVAYRGVWTGLGADSISWRHGDLVFSVGYADVPGEARPDTLAALADVVDALYQQQMLPVEQALADR